MVVQALGIGAGLVAGYFALKDNSSVDTLSHTATWDVPWKRNGDIDFKAGSDGLAKLNKDGQMFYAGTLDGKQVEISAASGEISSPDGEVADTLSARQLNSLMAFDDTVRARFSSGQESVSPAFPGLSRPTGGNYCDSHVCDAATREIMDGEGGTYR
jgi:hypothetical protein